jgi:site-specific DNA-methyltransferase (adenine-specific)
MKVELHHADCLDVLRGMESGSVGCTIVDPPYSERTHSGHDASSSIQYDKRPGVKCKRRSLQYQPWGKLDVDAVIQELCRVCSGWVVVMTDDVLAEPIRQAMLVSDRYPFAPIPFVHPGSRVRLTGDGPSSWTIWLVVCRPKTRAFASWGTLPGAYIAGHGWRDHRYIGGKPVELLRALVNDYSRPGDTVLDCFMGGGTPGVACKELGRSFIGVERDADAFAQAQARIDAARYKPGLAFAKTKKRKERGLL